MLLDSEQRHKEEHGMLRSIKPRIASQLESRYQPFQGDDFFEPGLQHVARARQALKGPG